MAYCNWKGKQLITCVRKNYCIVSPGQWGLHPLSHLSINCLASHLSGQVVHPIKEPKNLWKCSLYNKVFTKKDAHLKIQTIASLKLETHYAGRQQKNGGALLFGDDTQEKENWLKKLKVTIQIPIWSAISVPNNTVFWRWHDNMRWR